MSGLDDDRICSSDVHRRRIVRPVRHQYRSRATCGEVEILYSKEEDRTQPIVDARELTLKTRDIDREPNLILHLLSQVPVFLLQPTTQFFHTGLKEGLGDTPRI